MLKEAYIKMSSTKSKQRKEQVKFIASQESGRQYLMGVLKTLRKATKDIKNAKTSDEITEIYKKYRNELSQGESGPKQKIDDLSWFLTIGGDNDAFYKEFNEQPLTEEELQDIKDVIKGRA
ncbi:MAG: hypothetical protein LBD11_02830 [Candidatus Peribacteria bacterium]|jgi:hypothetical protein|nr:hypothetical protein [Candidatus Peribacteria bacterium]